MLLCNVKPVLDWLYKIDNALDLWLRRINRISIQNILFHTSPTQYLKCLC